MTHPRVWSASLPLDIDDNGDIVANPHVRPYNGRALNTEEIDAIVKIATEEGLQAAFEWMTEHC